MAILEYIGLQIGLSKLACALTLRCFCSEPYTTLIREAIHTRYALLPYFYTLFYEASVSGLPLMRPLWLEYPTETESFAIEDEFLLGRDLLVHGVFADVSALHPMNS